MSQRQTNDLRAQIGMQELGLLMSQYSYTVLSCPVLRTHRQSAFLPEAGREQKLGPAVGSEDWIEKHCS